VPEQGGGGEQEPRGAVAALRRPQRREGLLERMQVRPGHALDGGDLTVTALHGQGEAGEDGASVHEHRAGAAFPELTSVFGAHETEVLAQDLEERVVDGGKAL